MTGIIFTKQTRSILTLFGLLFAMTGCSSLLYYPSQEQFYDPAKFKLKYENIQFHSIDTNKTALEGWLFLPEKPLHTLKAIVVQFHGNAENRSTHFLNLHFLPKNNIAYFAFDYQGYGTSQGDPSPEGTVQDGIAAVEWVHTKFPKTPIVLLGQSLGGAIALRTAIELKNKIPLAWVVIDSSFASYKKMGRRVLSRSWLTWLFQPLGYLLLSDSWAPGDRIAEISPTPLLVIHGTQDPVVEYEMGEDLFNRATEPKEFWKIEGGEHCDVFMREGGKHQTEFLKRFDVILKK